jgi:hypothetical protein
MKVRLFGNTAIVTGTGSDGAGRYAWLDVFVRRNGRWQAVAPQSTKLENDGDGCCDRPGCYEGFVRRRRSPLQRFCSHPCRRAMERVWERERRWHETRAS